MTIITKPLTDKKQDQLKKPLVAAGEVPNANQVDVESVNEPQFSGRGRASLLTLFFVFLASLAVLGIGVIGGLYIYKTRAPAYPSKVQAWFQVPPSRNDPDLQMQDIANSFREEFEMDLESNYENINVPDLGKGRRGRFIHDFNANKTGIVDIDGGRCFVLPLNRARVWPPRSMYDLITKLSDGYYEVDTEVIRKTYRVELPPIKRLEDMGSFIYHNCEDLPTYKLVRVTDRLFKRSTVEKVVFQEFAGAKVTRMEIDLSPAYKYEKDHKIGKK